MVNEIFVNLPVKDLEKTKAFWGSLGFSFNPQFTDQNAGCLVLGEHFYIMLLLEKFFKTFIPGKEITDAEKTTEVINAFSVNSKEEVVGLVQKAIAAGASKYREPEDHGWMYSESFTDLDGHIWEVLYADLSKLPKSV
jgi:predicted lactoylglutathione lyase